jgi:radical SAM-linked protein
MVRQRVLMRFSKTGDLRLTSHRDLLRTLERLFRRAGLRLAMSEGFHPRPRLSFPSALALGVAGMDEVLELELSEPMPAEAVLAAVRPQSLPGLEFHSAEVLPAGTSNVPARAATYELSLPAERVAATAQRIAAVLARSPCWIDGPRRKQPLDLHDYLAELTLSGRRLRFKLRMEREGGVQAREVLAELGLGDLEALGIFLTRTAVELQSAAAPGHEADATACAGSAAAKPQLDRITTTHEARDADQRRPVGGMPHRDR